MLEFKNYSFTYAEEFQPVIRDISLGVAAGEVVVVTGKSGCGKTTLSRVVNGLIPELFEGNEEGACWVNGLATNNVPTFELAQQVGSVFQNPKTQFFTTDVMSELAFPLENRGIAREHIRERIGQVADIFGIHSLLNRSMFALSGGEKQMVAIASSYMSNPKLLLLDEPSSNLDSQSIERLSQVLAKLKRNGLSMLIIEHRLYYLRDLADRFLLMKHGEIAEHFNSKQLLQLSPSQRESLGIRSLSLEQVHEGECIPTTPEPESAVQSVNLSIKNLKYSYCAGEKNAIDIEHLNINNDEIVGIVGRNGAGKSTFAKALTGLIQVKNGGSVALNEHVLSPKDLVRESFLVFQDVNYQLFCESVSQELTLGNQGVSSEQLQEVASRLGLDDCLESNPNVLSGGEKQRLAVGCAVLSGKRIVIMDEPTSGLDLAHMQQVSQSINYLHSLGTIVLIISHDREFLQQTCTRFISFDQGHIVHDSHNLKLV